MAKNILLSTAPKSIQRLVKASRWLPKLLSFPVIILAVFFASFHIYFLDRIIPGVSVANVNLTGKTQAEANAMLSSLQPQQQITFISNNQKYKFDLQNAKLEYKYDKSAIRAFLYGRKSNIKDSLKQQFTALTQGINLPLVYNLDESATSDFVNKISNQLSVPSIEPGISIQNSSILINPGKNGQEVDTEKLRQDLYLALAYHQAKEIPISVNKITPQLSDEDVKTLQQRAQKLLGKSITINFEKNKYTYGENDLVTLLEPQEPTSGVKYEKIAKLTDELAQGINRPSKDAKFVFESGKVKEFEPSKNGIEVKKDELVQKIADALLTLENTEQKEIAIDLPVVSTKPEVANEEVNNLGINELIGKGESTFRGSIPTRVRNITLAATRLNGVLLKPGEEFSFNKSLGEVSNATGYEQAFVIKEGKTILDDGGGVCQVSTTMFRAALNTGLPILERHPHSYRVSYYEQGTKPGIDATIYQPGIDLKFKNDTPAHILIQTKLDLKNSKLAFEFYGTTDKRTSEITNIRLWDITQPPPDLYQDDPTMPAGAIKQVEHRIPGAKAAFDYKVTREGQVLIDKTFYSNYRAWQAVYLRGTATQ